jgi:hypothetical protein
MTKKKNPPANFYLKDFAKSKSHFIAGSKRNRKLWEKEYNVDFDKLTPSMVEERKAFKGYKLRGSNKVQRLSREDAEAALRRGAKKVFGNWNEYVKKHTSYRPKAGENWYEYTFNLSKLKSSKKRPAMKKKCHTVRRHTRCRKPSKKKK